MFVTVAALLFARVATIEGKVVMSDGSPAAKAFLVGQSFGMGNNRSWTHRVDCDENGKFSFPSDSPLARQLHVFSSDMKESFLAPITSAPTSPLEVHLKPSCDLTIRFRVLGQPASGLVTLSAMPNLTLPWLGDMDTKGEVHVWVPQAEYKVNIRSDECDFVQTDLFTKAGAQEVVVEGTPNPFRKIRGQMAPDLETMDTLGISKSVSLKDFRGKYVLLEFWGYWCKPCVESSLPGLIQLRKENPGLESKLVILAVHENSGGARKMSEIKKHLPQFEHDLWGGKLPFPIVLEKPASLTKKFGIRAYPTAVLIDPEGKVVDRAEPQMLKQTLGLR